MVKGIEIFQEYFKEYTDQYVLIGGAACSVSFEEQEINFGRTTKDRIIFENELYATRGKWIDANPHR